MASSQALDMGAWHYSGEVLTARNALLLASGWVLYQVFKAIYNISPLHPLSHVSQHPVFLDCPFRRGSLPVGKLSLLFVFRRFGPRGLRNIVPELPSGGKFTDSGW